MVLYRATMPAVLLELGFLSNPKDEKLLISKSGQLKLANHIFEGFKNYKNKYDNVDESLTEYKEEKSILQKDSPIDTGLIYKVQIATSSVKIPTLPENFNGLKDVEVYISGKYYKYTFGFSSNMKTANEHLNQAKKSGYESSFVVSFQDGKRLNWEKP
jgi:N-acetylmuramoyl-L-alanine amidase